MQTEDFARAYRAFVAKRTPVCSKAIDVADRDLPRLAVLRRRAPRAGARPAGVARRAAAAAATRPIPPPPCRSLRGAARRGRLAEVRGAAGLRRRRSTSIDVRSLCLIRETLGYASGLAEFAFAMQGLGSGPISLFGSDALKQQLPAGGRRRRRRSPRSRSPKPTPAPTWRRCRPRRAATAPRSSSTARRPGSRTPASPTTTSCSAAGPRAASASFVALVVDAGTPGLDVSPTIDVIAPHPLGTLTFTDCRVPADAIVGEPGKGMRVALGHARRVSDDRRRRRARVRPARARRGRRARAERASPSASRWPSSS